MFHIHVLYSIYDMEVDIKSDYKFSILSFLLINFLEAQIWCDFTEQPQAIIFQTDIHR